MFARRANPRNGQPQVDGSRKQGRRCTIIDAWAQHLTLRHSQNPIFDPLRTRAPVQTEQLPVATTTAAMNVAGDDRTLIAA